MIVLKVCNVSEPIHSFTGANGGLRILLYPLFNQIQAQLQKLSQIILNTLIVVYDQNITRNYVVYENIIYSVPDFLQDPSE